MRHPRALSKQSEHYKLRITLSTKTPHRLQHVQLPKKDLFLQLIGDNSQVNNSHKVKTMMTHHLATTFASLILLIFPLTSFSSLLTASSSLYSFLMNYNCFAFCCRNILYCSKYYSSVGWDSAFCLMRLYKGVSTVLILSLNDTFMSSPLCTLTIFTPHRCFVR